MAVFLLIVCVLSGLSLGLFVLQKAPSSAVRLYGPWGIAVVVALLTAIATAAFRLLSLDMDPLQHVTDPDILVDEVLSAFAFYGLLAAETVLLARWLSGRTAGLGPFLVAHIPATILLWLLTSFVGMALLPDS